MKSLKPHRNEARRRSTSIAVLLCVLGTWLTVADAATVRDNFETRIWSNNDGSDNWVGDWIEVDGDSTPPSPTNGNARITNGGELRLDDRPNTGGDPGVTRQANLAGATSATLSFQWRTSNNIEASDSVVVEPSANADGVDPAVTSIRVNPKGDLAGSIGSGDPSMQISFKAVVE